MSIYMLVSYYLITLGAALYIAVKGGSLTEVHLCIYNPVLKT